MTLSGILLSTLFLIGSYNVSPNNGSLEREARYNYFQYLSDNNIVAYENRFIDNLYNNDCFDFSTKITVFTHGMFGTKDHWFPKINGEPDYFSNESLPYKIVNTYGFDIDNIPILSFGPSFVDFDPITHECNVSNINVYQLTYTSNDYLFEPINFASYEKARELFSNHIALLYDFTVDDFEIGKTNEQMAECFCQSLDSFLAQVAVFYEGKLPSLNLIGHSRGGILNAYYASKREQIIDNLISIGSPLSGSIWGNVINSFYKIARNFSSNPNYQVNYDGLLNYENYYQIKNMYSTMIDPYKVCIGCEMTPFLFCNQILAALNSFQINYLDEIDFGDENIIGTLINDAISYLNNNINSFTASTVVGLCDLIRGTASVFRNTISGFSTLLEFGDYFANIFDISQSLTLTNFKDLCLQFLDDLITLLYAIPQFDNQNGCIKGDFCVELDSQLGNNFYAQTIDQQILIPFGMPGYINLQDKYLSQPLSEHVVHNYECNFPPITNAILSLLQNRNSIQYETVKPNYISIDINPYQVPFFNLTSAQIEEFYSPDYSFFGNQFGFRDYYYYENQIINNEYLMYRHIEVNNLRVDTKRMRCGYIQNERIVLSPNRTNAGFAFIEFYFSSPVYTLTFDVSLWSPYEYVTESNLSFATTINHDYSDFIFGESALYLSHAYDQYYTMTLRGQYTLMNDDPNFYGMFNKENVNNLPTDRDDPSLRVVHSSTGFTYFGLYAASNITSSDRNKGRICISNFKIYN